MTALDLYLKHVYLEELAPKSEGVAAMAFGTGWTLLLALGKLADSEKSSLGGRERPLEELHSPEE